MSDNNSIIPVVSWKELQKVLNGGADIMPFVKEIFLIDCKIAGTTHVEDIKGKTADVNKGDFLTFKREPDNQYDKFAILILNKNSDKIGYVPKGKNEILARLMDSGKLIFGRIEDKEIINNWVKISVKVYLQDL